MPPADTSDAALRLFADLEDALRHAPGLFESQWPATHEPDPFSTLADNPLNDFSFDRSHNELPNGTSHAMVGWTGQSSTSRENPDESRSDRAGRTDVRNHFDHGKHTNRRRPRSPSPIITILENIAASTSCFHMDNLQPSNERRVKKPRRELSEPARAKVREVRKRGACLRCRLQKIKVKFIIKDFSNAA